MLIEFLLETVLFIGIMAFFWVTNWHIDQVTEKIINAMKEREKS